MSNLKDTQRSFPVSIVMESSPSTSRWIDETWTAVGLVVRKDNAKGTQLIENGDSKQLIYNGLTLRLFLDECESYYHNLMSPEPGCFIVTRFEDEDGEETDTPIPFLATLSFDEAHAYLEGDDTVFAVPIPVELYKRAEAYIVDNYSAEKRKKRKRVDWKQKNKEA